MPVVVYVGKLHSILAKSKLSDALGSAAKEFPASKIAVIKGGDFKGVYLYLNGKPFDLYGGFSPKPYSEAGIIGFAFRDTVRRLAKELEAGF